MTPPSRPVPSPPPTPVYLLLLLFLSPSDLEANQQLFVQRHLSSDFSVGKEMVAWG